MTKQLLIYERAVPVSKQRHGDWSVKMGKDYGFTRQVNSLPLTAVEIPNAAAEYVIVFAGSGDAVMPAVLLGARDEQNLYLANEGEWKGKYIPAFARRYPFVFSSNDDGKTFTLCVDENFSGCNQEGLGERLFDAEGEQTQYLGSVLEFLKQYQAQFQRTKIFCDKLRELDLLEPMQAQFSLKTTGERVGLSGFMAINRGRLKNLAAEKLAELARSDELELAYLHLQSLRNVSVLAESMAPQAAMEGGTMAQEIDRTAPGDETVSEDMEPDLAADQEKSDKNVAKKKKGRAH